MFLFMTYYSLLTLNRTVSLHKIGNKEEEPRTEDLMLSEKHNTRWVREIVKLVKKK